VNLNPLVDARVSVRDPQCAVSDTTSADGGTPPTDKEKKEPEKKATVKEVAEAIKDIAVEVVLAPLDQTPPVISDLKPLVSEKAPEVIAPLLEAGMMDMRRRMEIISSGDEYADEWEKWKNLSLAKKNAYFQNKNQGPKRTAPDAAPGGGGCGKASNMASMFQAVYNCTQGGGSTQISGGRPLATPRPIDPAVQPGSRPANLLGCITQAGSLVRTSSNDPKCAAMRCAPGQTCPCEPAGGPKAQATDQVAPPQTKAGPDCMGDDCKPSGSVKPGTGSPKPTGGGPIDPRGGPPTKPAGK